MLLDNGAGASINAKAGLYGSTLQAASHKCSAQLVKLLLDHGADANGQDGFFGSPLQAALFLGREQIAWLLVNSGADTNVVAHDEHARRMIASILAEG